MLRGQHDADNDDDGDGGDDDNHRHHRTDMKVPIMMIM